MSEKKIIKNEGLLEKNFCQKKILLEIFFFFFFVKKSFVGEKRFIMFIKKKNQEEKFIVKIFNSTLPNALKELICHGSNGIHQRDHTN